MTSISDHKLTPIPMNTQLPDGNWSNSQVLCPLLTQPFCFMPYVPAVRPLRAFGRKKHLKILILCPKIVCLTSSVTPLKRPLCQIYRSSASCFEIMCPILMHFIFVKTAYLNLHLPFSGGNFHLKCIAAVLCVSKRLAPNAGERLK